MSSISVIVITKNEEANLPRCLESVRWANEIIVVDSGSTDRTLEIARTRGAKVFSEEWKGYTAQKNSCLAKVSSDWVLSIDADEELSAEAQKDIRALILKNDSSVGGYAFRRKVFYLGKWITHGDWYPDYVVRLWKRGKGRFEGRRVHESAHVNGAIRYLRSDILHYTYRNLADQRGRMETYAKLWAEDQFEKGRPFIWSDLYLRPPLRFLRAIVLKAGWLDGWRGFVIAWMCAREVFWKYRNLGREWKKDKSLPSKR